MISRVGASFNFHLLGLYCSSWSLAWWLRWSLSGACSVLRDLGWFGVQTESCLKSGSEDHDVLRDQHAAQPE
jgi:hypothetical protein